MSGAHPSFLELDLMALEERSEWARAHLQQCSRCSAHLERLRLPAPIPRWVQELDVAPRVRSSRPLAWRLLGALTATAAATVVVVTQVPREETAPARGQTAKGLPSVAVFVKHGDTVSLWDGQFKVLPGDSLRLRVEPEGFGFVTVAEPAEGGLRVLFAGPLRSRTADLLPTSWRLDAAPGPQRLIVMFSTAEIPWAQLGHLATKKPRNDDFWVTELVIWKAPHQ